MTLYAVSYHLPTNGTTIPGCHQAVLVDAPDEAAARAQMVEWGVAEESIVSIWILGE